MKKSIIFPAYNEEKRIGKTLAAYTRHFQNKDFEFIVVNDGSTDQTSRIVLNFAKREKRVRLIEHKTNRGKGQATLTGFHAARGAIIGYTDADLAYKIDDIARITTLLEHTPDIDGIIASRYLTHTIKDVPEPFTKKLLSRGLNLLIRILLGLHYADTQGGAKFFKRPVIDATRNHRFLCTGFSFDIEFLYTSKKAGFRIKEYPVRINSTHEGTTFAYKHVLIMFKDLMKLRLYASLGQL